MTVNVKLNYVHHSARKLRPVLSGFAGKPLDEALSRTSVMPQDSARLLNKTLRMAKAAAEEQKFTSNEMVVSQVFASEGPKIKRSRANSRGHSNKYVKHLAHITVVLSEQPNKEMGNDAPRAPRGKIETKVRKRQ